MILAKTVKDQYHLRVTFCLPDHLRAIAARSTAFASHFLGHEGPGSICAFLRSKGWALNLEAAHTKIDRRVTFVHVKVKLTYTGYRGRCLFSPRYIILSFTLAAVNYEDVILAIFRYLQVLRSSASTLPSYHAAELTRLAALNFTYACPPSPDAYARSLAKSLLLTLPPKRLLDQEALVREYNPLELRTLLITMIPERCRIVLSAQEHIERIVGKKEWKCERRYDSEYSVQRISETFIQKVSTLVSSVKVSVESSYN